MKKKFINSDNESLFYIFIIFSILIIIGIFTSSIFYLSKLKISIFKFSIFNILTISFSILFSIFLFYRYIKSIIFYTVFLSIFILLVCLANKIPLLSIMLIIGLVFLFIKAKKIIFTKFIY